MHALLGCSESQQHARVSAFSPTEIRWKTTNQTASIAATIRDQTYDNWTRLWNNYRRNGGKLKIWIGQPDYGDMKENIVKCAENGTKAVCIQGAIAGDAIREGEHEQVKEWLELVKSFGLPAGMASHYPHALLKGEQLGLPAEWYHLTIGVPDTFPEVATASRFPAGWDGNSGTPKNWPEAASSIQGFASRSLTPAPSALASPCKDSPIEPSHRRAAIIVGEATGATRVCAAKRPGETWGDEDKVEMDDSAIAASVGSRRHRRQSAPRVDTGQSEDNAACVQ